MFRLQVKIKGKWVWGINDYDTEEQAMERLMKLRAVGVQARIKPSAELFN